MSKLMELNKKRDKKVEEKNSSLRLKWDIEEEISQINKDKQSAQHKNDFLTIDKLNLRRKKLLNEQYSLNNNIKKINEELDKLENLIEQEKIIELNSRFLNGKNLPDEKIKGLVNASIDLSEKYKSKINEYSGFLKKLDSTFKEVVDVSFHDYLKQIRLKVEKEKGYLLEYREQCFEFDQLESLKHNLFVADRNLLMFETDFSISKTINLKFNSVIKDFVDFLEDSYFKLERIDKKFRYYDLNQVRMDVQNKISDLSNFKKECFELNRLGDLNDAIGTSKKDLEKIKDDLMQNLNKSKKLSKKFDNFMEYYIGLLNSFDSKLEELEDKFWHDDYEMVRNEIKTKVDSLLHFQNLCVELNRLDDFSEAITNTRKDLIKIRLDFNKSIDKSKMLSDKFNSTIEDYNAFLLKLDSDLKEINDESLVNVLNKIIIETKTKLEGLLDYKEEYAEPTHYDDLNGVIDDAINDLVKIKDNFAKAINGNLNELIIEAKSIIESKSSIYLELNSKLSDLIDNAQKLNDYAYKLKLMEDLDETKLKLDQEFENLNDIENKLIKVTHDSIDVQLINNETDNVNILIYQLIDINFKNIEERIIEEEKNYSTLSDLNEDIGSENIEDLLNELDKFFNKPIFMRQLKRYDLDDDELKIVKDEIRLDIINHVISESDDIKKIIKTRCKEFRKKHAGIEDSEINNLLDNINVEGIDDDIVKECKNNVKQDFFEGNVTINNVELKFNNYLNKKINESNQLKELDKIKNNPNVPSIKIHLTQEENDEIYRITEMEILSVHGINGSVENRVHYWVNQKIRDNQSIARGRLNSLKREFSNLTQLSKTQQSEFVYQIEFYISENKLKPYDITEENIIVFSKDFKENGKLKL